MAREKARPSAHGLVPRASRLPKPDCCLRKAYVKMGGECD